MNLSYRTRRRLRRLGITLLVTVLIALVVWFCWIVWVGRYIVYTPEGARLDFSIDPQLPTGEAAKPPATGQTVPIIYDEPEVEEPLPNYDQTAISGYYVDFEDLCEDVSVVKAQLQQLPAGTAVLLDVKNTKGYFYYSTAVGETTSSDLDIAAMDDLISWLAGSELYTIARLPAFRDWEFGLNNVPSGLPKKDGNGSLWMDDTNCYWLDPTAEDTLNYLVRITAELRGLGFDEVVFKDFRFPNTEKIEFEGDKAQAIADAAAKLVDACATDRFCVSFYSAEPTFALPAGRVRLYLEDVAAADVHSVAQQVATDDPAVHVMFLTTVNDTRFDEYSVLRPLESAH